MFVIEDELKKLPGCPGVYMHKDSLGEIIYVGKAINLRKRVSSYFRKTGNRSAKLCAMVDVIAEFDYITCATEMEALILECNLIKKYMPRYNILLKDDKTYPYIVVTTEEEYPRVYRMRRLLRDGNKYYGPYSDVGAVSQILALIDEMYPLKKCRNQVFRDGVRPCLNYHIGKCLGVCQGTVNKQEYGEMISEILDILGGHDSKLLRTLDAKMREASDLMKYEEAAKYRDYINAIKRLDETQRATMLGDRDVDVLIPVMTKRSNVVAQYRVREGKLIGREVVYMRDNDYSPEEQASSEDIIQAFIKQHYPSSSKLPREVLLSRPIEETELLEGLLNSVNEQNAEAGNDILHKTRILVPERGDKRAIVKLAETDSIELARSLDERAEREAEKKSKLRDRIAKIITRCCILNGSVPRLIDDEDEREYRIEAYDISNMNGLDTVGAMVVYEGRKAIRSDYRKFKVKTAASSDDYGALQEVIYRRIKRAKNGDPGFSTYPDVMFIDGGLGQVHAVLKVIDAYGMSIPVVGLAKDDAHRTRAIVFDDGSEIPLRDDPILFSYCGTIQEEVHRFAITFMKGVHGKSQTKSVLEDIPGVGPRRRGELLKAFGSIQGIKAASYEELLDAGMNSKVAGSVIEFFRNRE